MSLEHKTLPLLAPRTTDWANGRFDTNVEQINKFEHAAFSVVSTTLYRLS